jgi:hypothetical protein
MILWRGWGAIVILIVFGSCCLLNLLCNVFAGNDYWETHCWPFASAFVLAGVIIWLVNSYLLDQPERVLVDEKTGERVRLVKRSRLFFIDIKWWAWICYAIGLIIWAMRVVPGKPK